MSKASRGQLDLPEIGYGVCGLRTARLTSLLPVLSEMPARLGGVRTAELWPGDTGKRLARAPFRLAYVLQSYVSLTRSTLAAREGDSTHRELARAGPVSGDPRRESAWLSRIRVTWSQI